MSITGIPFRIVMELTYCTGASLLAIALWRVGVPCAVAGIAAMAAILHPSSFQLPNQFGAEILLAPLLMFALAGSLEWWVGRQRNRYWRQVFWTALFWALAWNVRKESVVLLPFFGSMAFCLWLADRSSGWRCVLHRIAIGVCIPLLCCAFLATAFKAINYCRWGLFANSVITAPGYKAAFKALQRIRPSHSIDYVPVTVEARRQAYEASSSFKKLEPVLEGDLGKGWAKFSSEFTGGKGLGPLDPLEISAGWFYWALYESAVETGYGPSPADVDSFFSKVAKEVNQALADGRLPARFVPIALIDPDFLRWAPRLGPSLSAVYKTCITPAAPYRQTVDQPFLDAQYVHLFDSLANRRAFHLNLAPGTVQGWVLAPKDKIVTLSLRSAHGPSLPLIPTTRRPDVGPDAVGFNSGEPSGGKKQWKSMSLVATMESGREVAWEIKTLVPGKIVRQDVDGQSIQLACERIHSPHESGLWQAQSKWEQSYYTIVRWTQWLALAGIALALVSLPWRRTKAGIIVAIVLLATTVASRIAFFTILDACAWWGAQPRYLFAVMPLHGVLLVLGVWLLFKECAAHLKTRRDSLGEPAQPQIPVLR